MGLDYDTLPGMLGHPSGRGRRSTKGKEENRQGPVGNRRVRAKASYRLIQYVAESEEVRGDSLTGIDNLELQQGDFDGNVCRPKFVARGLRRWHRTTLYPVLDSNALPAVLQIVGQEIDDLCRGEE